MKTSDLGHMELIFVNNCRHLGHMELILCQFIPEMIFLLAMFGYMDALIITKWIKYDASDASCAPNILIGRWQVRRLRRQLRAKYTHRLVASTTPPTPAVHQIYS